MKSYIIEYGKKGESKLYGTVLAKNRYEAIGIAIEELIPRTENPLGYEIKVIGIVTKHGIQELIRR